MPKVEIYFKDYCPYCHKAKNLLDTKGVKYTLHDITHDATGQKEMETRIPGARTVPQILINDKPIGGCDDLHALDASGKLDKMLNAKNNNSPKP